MMINLFIDFLISVIYFSVVEFPFGLFFSQFLSSTEDTSRYIKNTYKSILKDSIPNRKIDNRFE